MPKFVFQEIKGDGGGTADTAWIKSIQYTKSETDANGRLVDIYTITKTDGSTSTLTITNGKDGVGISSIEYVETRGLNDVYEITFTDGSTYQYAVTNGKSAYQYAKDAGYTGTEVQFADKLAFVHPSWALQSLKPTYTPTEVGADAAGTAESAVSNHNTSATAHNDLRIVLQDLIDQVYALLNSDDETLNETKEIVAYIKANRTLIDNVTTAKVNVTDIVNDLATNLANKPLSAAQGVALKALIDAIVIPTKVSQLTNDKNYLTSVPSEYVTETELNQKGYLTQHQDISGKADKSSAETWTFKLKDGSTVTKKVVLA